MFEIDRTFCQRNPKTGLMEWFFSAREGLFGPYESKQMAVKELNEFVERHKLSGDDGGRSKAQNKKGKSRLTLAPLEHQENEAVFFDFSKRKKGID